MKNKLLFMPGRMVFTAAGGEVSPSLRTTEKVAQGPEQMKADDLANPENRQKVFANAQESKVRLDKVISEEQAKGSSDRLTHLVSLQTNLNELITQYRAASFDSDPNVAKDRAQELKNHLQKVTRATAGDRPVTPNPATEARVAQLTAELNGTDKKISPADLRVAQLTGELAALDKTTLDSLNKTGGPQGPDSAKPAEAKPASAADQRAAQLLKELGEMDITAAKTVPAQARTVASKPASATAKEVPSTAVTSKPKASPPPVAQGEKAKESPSA